MNPALDPAQLDTLLDKLLDNRLSADETAQLESAMHSDPSVRAHVLENLHVNACFEWEFHRPALPSVPFPEERAELADPHESRWDRIRTFVNSPMTLSLTVAALATAIIVLSMAVTNVPELRKRMSSPTEARFVANIIETNGAAWRLAEDQSPPEQLQAGDEIELIEGFAKVELFSGATAVLEAPTKLTFTEENAVHLDRGVAAFHVSPDAIGFRVETASASIVDLGTEFGVQVGGDEATDIYVLNGQVEVRPTESGAGGQPYRLAKGQSARFETGVATRFDSAISSDRFATNVRRTTITYLKACSQPVYRLIDADGDDLGDEAQLVNGGISAVGEWNGSSPRDNEGRLWISFDLSEADLHNMAHAERVTALFRVSEAQGIPLKLAAYGISLDSESVSQPADYQAAGEVLAGDLSSTGSAKSNLLIDVTDFAKQVAASGGTRFAIRLQVDHPQLPTDDNRHDNVLFVCAESETSHAPGLLVRVPRAKHQAISLKDESSRKTTSYSSP